MSLIENIFYASMAVIAVLYLYAIHRAIKKRNIILILYNAVLSFTYCAKPILTSLGYYVGYSGIEYLSWLGIAVFFMVNISFILGQLIAPIITMRLRFAQMRYVKARKLNILYILLLLILFAYFRMGFESAQVYNEARLEYAHANGAGQLIKDVFINFNTYSIIYTNALLALIVAGIALLIAGTKQAAVAPLLLYVTYIFYIKKVPLKITKIIKLSLVSVILLVLMQTYRSHQGFNEGLTLSGILQTIAIPFDAFDNGMKILYSYEASDFPRGFLVPYSLGYVQDYILQLVPRAIWTEKPEVYGFWRVMEEYLPLLYSGPKGMSVSLSLPVDIFFGYGLFFGLPLIFLVGNVLSSINEKDLDKIYFPFLICAVIGFSRSGLQIVPIVVLQIALIAAIIIAQRGLKKIV